MKRSDFDRRSGLEMIKLEFTLKLKIKRNAIKHVLKQPIIVVYFEFETVLKFYNPEARSWLSKISFV